MRGFKKLILTSAILAASSSAFAMQALDEETMSATTGQDGLSIRIDSSKIADLDITWVDRGGFGATFSSDGGVQITNIGMSLTNLDITVDAGSDAVAGAQLNIGFSTADNIVVNLNGTTISVGDATGVNTGNTTLGGTPRTIMSFGPAATITIGGGINGSIKLGDRLAGEHLMSLNTNAFDVTLAGGVQILDGANTGIGVGTVTISQLDLATNIDVTGGVGGGLVIDNSGTTIGQVSLETVKLGDLAAAAPDIGDVYLTGMTINSIMTIRGH